ncbi:MAG: hypothetical protein AAF620_15635, partial [Bacteroidota bacterium]
LNIKSIEALDDFLDIIEITRFRKDMRNLLMNYLIHEFEELGPEFGHFLEDMKFFLNFLDVVESQAAFQERKGI